MSYLTYFDLVEQLIISSYGGPQDAEQRDIRAAVQRAYAELTTIRDWQYYSTHGRLITQAPYGDGTISSSGDTVTLSGGTWPSWAATGAYLKVAQQICRVATRNSATVLTLDSTLTLKENLTSQPYTLYRTVYPLPADFRNLDEPTDEFNWWAGMYLTPDEAMKVERINNSSGKPYHWTIIKDPDSTGWAIKLIGFPTRQETVDFIYRRYPRGLKYSGHESVARFASAKGGESGGVDPEEITLTGATFRSDMAGSIIRIGSSTEYPGTIESLNPYLLERELGGITSLGVPNDLAGVSPAVDFAASRAIVTDPVDLPRHMWGVMATACSYFLARIRGADVDRWSSLYQRDLRLAMETEQLAPLSGRTRRVWHSGGWRSPLLPDKG